MKNFLKISCLLLLIAELLLLEKLRIETPTPTASRIKNPEPTAQAYQPTETASPTVSNPRPRGDRRAGSRGPGGHPGADARPAPGVCDLLRGGLHPLVERQLPVPPGGLCRRDGGGLRLPLLQHGQVLRQ